MAFIYKITNIINGKYYIGETKGKNPETRWKRHIQTLRNQGGCPALKNAIKKYGIENFKFNILIICFDDDRFIYEKEYINKLNSQVPNGYNILPGGEGGGFFGKTHSQESIKKIIDSCKRFRKENPNYFETYREKLKESMNKVDISTAVKTSEKFKKAIEDGRVGGKGHKNGKMSEETKKKISESLLKRYMTYNAINIQNHREIMAKVKGRKVAQYSKDNIFIKQYPAIAEAGRISGVKSKNIQQVLSGNTKTAGGYIWKYVNEGT